MKVFQTAARPLLLGLGGMLVLELLFMCICFFVGQR